MDYYDTGNIRVIYPINIKKNTYTSVNKGEEQQSFM